ncbi:MAG: anaerobic ribonucleoside-triphosphate reductase activating protein [Candidatus Omnitrophica bacterium]|nr:anaerobic ribonucleoside-triphosphate reductase activating protein [Candidatus Omnitrophota bacterium]
MRIGGFVKSSLVDYPGRVSAVVFTQGCNFRCPYCHNKELVIPSCYKESLPEQDVLRFLEKRKDILQGVVVTGGEPLLQQDLPSFLQKIKDIGYLIKLDTNGSYPDKLKGLLEAGLVDFIAMDVKAPLEKYSDLAGVEVDTQAIEKSIKIILNSGVDYLFRTTIVRPLFEEGDFEKILSLIKGSRSYVLQNFVPQDSVLDSSLLDQRHYSDEEYEEIKSRWQKG